MNIELLEVAPIKFNHKIVFLSEQDIEKYIDQEACPVCLSNDLRVAVEIGGHDWTNVITISQCQSCSHIFYGRCPSEADIINFYQEQWMQSNDAQKLEKPIKPNPFFKISDLLKVLEYNYKDAEIFDVGCGSANLLMGLKENGFSNLWGCEQSPLRYQTSKNMLGERIFNAGYQDVKIEQKFDIIYSNHVIEHIFSPNDYFRWCNQNLKEDGLIICFMPDSEVETAIGQSLFFPHLHSFSKESAIALGNAYGYNCAFWKNCRLDEMGIIYTRSKDIYEKMRKNEQLVTDENVTIKPKEESFHRLQKPWSIKKRGEIFVTYQITSFVTSPQTIKRSFAELDFIKGSFLRLLRFLSSQSSQLGFKTLSGRFYSLLRLISSPQHQVKSFGFVRYRTTASNDNEQNAPRLSMKNQAILITK